MRRLLITLLACVLVSVPVVSAAATEQEIALVIIAKDGQCLKYQNGIVYDKSTGLEWYAGPDDDTEWYMAELWVKNLIVGGPGWRLPTVYELKSLFKHGAGSRNMTPLLETTGWWIWTSYEDKSFNFHNGRSDARSSTYDRRVFAVRSRN